jgi:EXLDI family protein
MSKYTILDGHPVPYSLTVQIDGESFTEGPHREAMAEAEKFVAQKGMKIDRWEGSYAFYSAIPAALEKIVIKRDGLPPIAFTGEEIGSGCNRGHNSTRWTTVRIYRTAGGRFVAEVKRRTQWQGESDDFSGTSKATAEEIIEWLRGDGETLGGVSQEAVEEAAKNEPAFAAAWVETVD